MKKTLLILFSAIAVISCSTEKSNISEVGYMELGASIEPATKANLNGALNTLWAAGDVIRVYVSNNANDWNTIADFTLSAGSGTTSGTFRCGTDYSSGNHWDWYSFFPYNYHSGVGTPGTIASNMGGDGFYFYFPESYYDYTSGQSFLPLLANMTGGAPQPTSASFKFVGGAVVLDLTGVPGAAHSVGLTVAGKNIIGWPGKVILSDVGTESGKVVASDGDNSTVWLNIDDSGNVDRAFNFIFPIPTISTTSNLTFTMYDKNDLMIWQKTASGQPAIGRAQALVMPTKAVAPTLRDFYLRGWINNADVENNSIAFSSGKVNSYTFSSDSYLYLYSNSTGKAYVPESSVDSGISAECFKVDSWNKSTCPKLKVPAGTYEINISYNSSGSITLSYTSK